MLSTMTKKTIILPVKAEPASLTGLKHKGRQKSLSFSRCSSLFRNPSLAFFLRNESAERLRLLLVL